MLAELWRMWTPRLLLLGMEDGLAIVEKSLGEPHKVRHGMTQQFCSSVCAQKRVLLLDPFLSVNMYSGLIHKHQTWKQLGCLSVDEWIKRLWPMRTTESQSATGRSEFWYLLQRGCIFFIIINI